MVLCSARVFGLEVFHLLEIARGLNTRREGNVGYVEVESEIVWVQFRGCKMLVNCCSDQEKKFVRLSPEAGEVCALPCHAWGVCCDRKEVEQKFERGLGNENMFATALTKRRWLEMSRCHVMYPVCCHVTILGEMARVNGTAGNKYR